MKNSSCEIQGDIKKMLSELRPYVTGRELANVLSISPNHWAKMVSGFAPMSELQRKKIIEYLELIKQKLLTTPKHIM